MGLTLVSSLEVSVDSHKLSTKSGISGDSDAIFATHGDHRVTVVSVNTLKKIKIRIRIRIKTFLLFG